MNKTIKASDVYVCWELLCFTQTMRSLSLRKKPTTFCGVHALVGQHCDARWALPAHRYWYLQDVDNAASTAETYVFLLHMRVSISIGPAAAASVEAAAR